MYIAHLGLTSCNSVFKQFMDIQGASRSEVNSHRSFLKYLYSLSDLQTLLFISVMQMFTLKGHTIMNVITPGGGPIMNSVVP